MKALSVGRKVILGIGSVIAIGAASSAASPPPKVAPVTHSNTKPHTVMSVNTEVKTQATTKPVPFQKDTEDDSNLVSGTTKTITQGINGTETIVYKVTYTNGIETGRQKISDEVTTQPVNQLTAIGTYVAPTQNCPNGTYINNAGNTVCSPYAATSSPAGATAKCLDGTYSFSQSHRGTCSHHGGVSTWL